MINEKEFKKTFYMGDIAINENKDVMNNIELGWCMCEALYEQKIKEVLKILKGGQDADV